MRARYSQMDTARRSCAFVALAALLFIGAVSAAGEVSYEDCVGQAAAFLSGMKIDDQVVARVEEARESYDATIGDEYFIPPAPEGCNKLQDIMFKLAEAVPCYDDRSMMRSSSGNIVQDIIKSEISAGEAIEASFACQGARLAGSYLQTFGLLDAVKANNAKRLAAENESANVKQE